MTAHRAPGSDEAATSVGLLVKLADALVWVSVLVGVGAVIGGVTIAQTTRATTTLFGQRATTTYPYIWAGVAAGVAGLVAALVIGVIAVWAKAWAETR